MPKWKDVTTLALFIYCIGVIFFALHPFEDAQWADWSAAAIAGVAAVSLVAYASPSIQFPGEEYAYLLTGFAGFNAVLLYLIHTDDNSYRRTAIVLFLLSGAISGYGAFLAQDQLDDE